MNLNREQRTKIYNALLLIRNATNELDECIVTLTKDSEEYKILDSYYTRLNGIRNMLYVIQKEAK